MTGTSTGLYADYKTAWTLLPWRERADLKQAALKGQRSRNREDAALTLWWIQKELRYGLRDSLLTGVVAVVFVVILAAVVDGRPPTNLNEVLEQNPYLPVFLLFAFAPWSFGSRRRRLRIAAQLNAAVLAGKTFNSPPDPEEAERLLRRARKEGWFRGTRPER